MVELVAIAARDAVLEVTEGRSGVTSRVVGSGNAAAGDPVAFEDEGP
ncbi:MAG: hypothetical protein JRG83_18630 [Deltaproteobacteria bacterium]|nr:hypothetical protein [Deltaproteobacteria bacterium]